MKVLRRVGSVLMFLFVMAYLLFAPAYFMPLLRQNAYEKWLMGNKPDYTGIINVWHVVEFKPYRGGLSGSLQSVAKKIQKKNYGIFFEVYAMTEQEARERIARGERPDVLSFYSGFCDDQDLKELPFLDLDLKGNLVESGQGAKLKGIPYAMSGYFLLLRTEYLQERSVPVPEAVTEELLSSMQQQLTFERGRKKTQIQGLSGDPVLAYIQGARETVAPYESFLNGTASMAIADLRAVGDLYRKAEQGKGFSFSALPLSGYTPLVQYLGIDRRTEEGKLPYALKFIELVLEDSFQKSLFEVGALPVKDVAPKEDAVLEPVVLALNEALKNPVAPNTFLYKIRRDQLYEAAEDALSGAPNRNFDERLKELVKGWKIK